MDHATTTDDTATFALINFLRNEADASEQKAKAWRQQADLLAAQHGISDELQQRYEIDPSQLPPLDKRGVPKYKGKKRGRKPKARQRHHNPNRRKRQHTAYTLYVQQHYGTLKAQHAGWPSKDLISVIAKQWAAESDESKREWKERALATHDQEDDEEDVNPDTESNSTDMELEEAAAYEESAAAQAAAAAAEAADDDEYEDDTAEEAPPPVEPVVDDAPNPTRRRRR